MNLPKPPATSRAPTGRVDVHSHLLPGVDDGCRDLDESIACARRMVAAGYTHSFCTPHVWPNLTVTHPDLITEHVERLQGALAAAAVPLRLFPGGEINLRPDTNQTVAQKLVTYGMRGKFLLCDIWADALPGFFAETIAWLQSQGLTVILAHPERMKAVHAKPELFYQFEAMGLLLQCNLQCLSDPIGVPTRDIAERFLGEGKYFLLGSDLHNLPTLDLRLNGLRRAIELVGEAGVAKLTVEHPRLLLS